MAEIIGLTASLITLAGVGAKLASTLRDATSILTSSTHEARLIAADISLFSSSLVQLSKTLPMVANYDIPQAEKLLEITEVLVLACSSLVDELQRYIGDPVVLRMRGGMWKRAVGWHFRWFLQREKVGFVKGLMESFKATLVFLVATMDLAVGVEQGAEHGVRESLKMQVETNMRFAEDAKDNLLQCRELKGEQEVPALSDGLEFIETPEDASKGSVPMLDLPTRSLVPYEQNNSSPGRSLDLQFNHEDDVLQVACLDECSTELVGILKVQENTLEVAEALLQTSPAPTFSWGSPRASQSPRNRPRDGISLSGEAASGKTARGESSRKATGLPNSRLPTHKSRTPSVGSVDPSSKPDQPTSGLDPLQSLDAEQPSSSQNPGGGLDDHQDIQRMIQRIINETLSSQRHGSSADSTIKSQDSFDFMKPIAPPSGTLPSDGTSPFSFTQPAVSPAQASDQTPLSKSDPSHRKTLISPETSLPLADEDGSERLTRLERTLLAERDELTRQNAVKAEHDIAARILEATNTAREEAEKKAKAAEELREKALAEAEEVKKTKENVEWERFLEKQKAARSIKLRDPFGRQYSFPWDRVATWEGMYETIKQYLGSDDYFGSFIKEGDYFLAGMNGDTITPEDWYKVVKPDMEITMYLQVKPKPTLETGSPKERESSKNEAAVKGPRYKSLGRFF